MKHLRIATWNVHGAVGVDFVRSVERVADVLRALAVDIALLQELDVGRARSKGMDQPGAIAVRLGFSHVFGAALRDGDASYGNAILARTPLEEPSTFVLPVGEGAEPRAATRAVAVTPLGPIELVVTHFGLMSRDREPQARALAEHLGAPTVPRIVGGDLNDGPRSYAVRRLCEGGLVRADTRPSFPAIAPFMRLDHLMIDRRLTVAAVERPSLRTIRGASDHLPIVVTLEGPEVP